MLQNLIVIALIFFVAPISSIVFGQTPGAIKPVYVIGDLAAVSANKVTVASKTGNVDVGLTDATVYKRMPPTEKINLAGATDGKFSDIAAGDKMVISALPSADGKVLTARTVYFTTKADIAAKNAKEAEEWRTRGISGKVLSVNASTNQIGIETGSLMAKTTVTLTPKANAKVLRYAPDSIKFADAKPSSLVDIKPGDQLRALGDKSQDGTAFSADTVLTGGFRQSAGTIKSIDVAANEVVVTDVATNKDVTIAFGDAILLKRFPEEMAQRMMAAQMGGAGAVRPAGAPAGQATPPPAQTAPPAGQATPGPGRPGMNGGPRGGLDEMVERAPNITAGDLKVGEMIAVLTAAQDAAAPAAKIKAIKLIAGVEPFVRMAQAAAAAGGRRPGQGVSGTFSIPGLDGIGF